MNKKGGQINFIANLVLISLFAIAIVTFAVNFGIDNSTSVNIQDDSELSGMSAGLTNDVQVLYSDVNTSSKAMQESTISSQTDATEGGTSFKVGTATALLMGKRVIQIGYTKIFGSGSGFGIFLTALISVLGFIGVMYIWKTWKGGSPD